VTRRAPAPLLVLVAVTVEFIGPLILATVVSHRRKDLLAIAMTVAAGLVMGVGSATSAPEAVAETTNQ
jgi:inner membrane transporter RhtA